MGIPVWRVISDVARSDTAGFQRPGPVAPLFRWDDGQDGCGRLHPCKRDG
jgi:hypothetical protein